MDGNMSDVNVVVIMASKEHTTELTSSCRSMLKNVADKILRQHDRQHEKPHG
jgi:hypothetical protein